MKFFLDWDFKRRLSLKLLSDQDLGLIDSLLFSSDSKCHEVLCSADLNGRVGLGHDFHASLGFISSNLSRRNSIHADDVCRLELHDLI